MKAVPAPGFGKGETPDGFVSMLITPGAAHKFQIRFGEQFRVNFPGEGERS
jgi:hypothetical protein